MAHLTYAESVGPLGELGALFNPGMRHEIEERKSKANRREEEGNARDGDVRIDLASGVAVINVPGKGAAADDAVESVPDPSADADRPTSSRPAPTPAAARRAERARTTDRTKKTADRSKPADRKPADDQPRAGAVPTSKATRHGR